jgi:hypothetical protein
MKTGKTYTVTFKVEMPHLVATPAMVEYELKDLLKVAVLPAMGGELVPLTFTVKNARG